MTKNSIYKSEAGKKAIISYYDTLLSNWHKPSVQHHLPTSYGETFVIESGDKSLPKLVLLHGTSSNSAMWMSDVITYSKNFNVFAIDIIGECGKSAEIRPDFKSPDYAQWLNEVLENLGVERAVFIGCSLGGWMVTDFAIRFPEKANKLVLFATAGITQVRLKTVFLIVIISLFGKWGVNQLNKMVYGNLDIDKAALEFASLVKKYFIPRAEVLPVFNDAELGKIQCPVMFIGGEKDCFYNSEKTSLRLTNLIENFEGEILPNTGHVWLNQERKVLDFINRD